MAGGWRIIKTMSQRITKLIPFGGFSAETAGALTLLGTVHFGTCKHHAGSRPFVGVLPSPCMGLGADDSGRRSDWRLLVSFRCGADSEVHIERVLSHRQGQFRIQ